MWWLVFALARPPAEQTRIRVEFAPGGDCIVSVVGARGRASVTYPRRTAEWRCAVPALADTAGGGASVVLEVWLPGGAARPVGEFPRLAWARRDGRWVGAARLAAPPAFVRVPTPGRAAWWRAVDLAVLAAALAAGLWSVIRGREA